MVPTATAFQPVAANYVAKTGSLALKREPVKLWVFRVLTGMSKEELERAALADLHPVAGPPDPDDSDAGQAADGTDRDEGDPGDRAGR